MKTLDKGKWAEKVAATWLEAQSQKEAGFAYHRYPDAKAARGALSAQPADFLVSFKRGDLREVYHLEVKETEQTIRLPKSKLSQYGKLKMFNDAGIRAVVLVHRSTVGDWLYFDERHLFQQDECPPSFPFQFCPKFVSAEEALKYIFL